MAGATWMLRVAREVYHPWYARPGRLLLLLLVDRRRRRVGHGQAGPLAAGASHPARHPALTWSVALPIWIALAAMSLWLAPAAAYLWIVPLFSAALSCDHASRNDPLVRVASVVVLWVSGTMWLREATDLSRFIVAIMGRLPIVTPFFVYAAVLSAAGRWWRRPSLRSSPPNGRCPALGDHPAILGRWPPLPAAAYAAPAYTQEQPLRRYARAFQDADSPTATWEVASVEPGLDLAPGAPGEWTPTDGGAASDKIPWGRYSFPFVFRAEGPSLGPAPAALGSRSSR